MSALSVVVQVRREPKSVGEETHGMYASEEGATSFNKRDASESKSARRANE